MNNKKFENGINEVKKTASYTIILSTILSCIISFGNPSFCFYFPFVTAIAMATQFCFGFISFDTMVLSKPMMFLLFVAFVLLSVFSFSKIELINH